MFGWLKRKDIKLVDAKAEGSPYKKFCALKKRSPIKIRTSENPFELILEYPAGLRVRAVVEKDGEGNFIIEDGQSEETINSKCIKGKLLKLKIITDLLSQEVEVDLKEWSKFMEKVVDAGLIDRAFKIKKGAGSK